MSNEAPQQTLKQPVQPPMQIELQNVKKVYPVTGGEVVALDNISLKIRKGDIFGIIGLSGAGKSTLIRCINRLDTPTEGKILIDGQNVPDMSKQQLRQMRRKVSMIFQQFNLLMQQTVAKNIAYPMECIGVPRAKINARVKELLEVVGLESKAKAYPAQLSGGQRQRVAIARALVTGPSIICMDEPLSNLDAKLRVQLRNELKKMQREFGITTIYVTHDQEEALTLSDRIAVFNKGYIEQIGTPNEIYNHSKTEFVCNFIGDINRVEAPIAAKMKLAAGQNHFIRLERLHVNKPKRDDEILIDGVVENIEYYGLYIKYYIDVGSQILKAIEKNDGINIYAPGEKVTVAMKPTDVMSYDAQ